MGRILAHDDIRYFRNQTKPQVDLVAGYGLAGLAGTRVSRPNPLSSANRDGALLRLKTCKTFWCRELLMSAERCR